MQGTNMNNAIQTKKKIIDIIKLHGPSLPVQIASKVGISSLFAGAFLSEAANEELLKISNMKVGGSPLYFIKGQEYALEKFYTYLPEKEREAFLLLKQNKILRDREQQPAIRVALRALKDFARAFSNDNEIFWRFHSVTEQEVRELFEKPSIIEKPIITEKPKIIEKPIRIEQKIEKTRLKPREISAEISSGEEQLDIGLKPAKITKSISREKAQEKPREKKIRKSSSFLEQVISFLTKHNIELINIEKSAKKEVFVKVRENGKSLLLYAVNKKLADSDLVKAYKKAQELSLPYFILAKGEPSKKLRETIEASKFLTKIDKIE